MAFYSGVVEHNTSLQIYLAGWGIERNNESFQLNDVVVGQPRKYHRIIRATPSHCFLLHLESRSRSLYFQ
jgi:hypothetical protein